MNFCHVPLTDLSDSWSKSSWIWYSWVSWVGIELNIVMGPCFSATLCCCWAMCVLRLSWLREMGSHLFHECAGCALVWLFVCPLLVYKNFVIKILHNVNNVTLSHYWLTLRYICIVQRGLILHLGPWLYVRSWYAALSCVSGLGWVGRCLIGLGRWCVSLELTVPFLLTYLGTHPCKNL